MKSLLLFALLIPDLLLAHVSLEKTEAESGSHYKGIMGIDHGCDGSATTKVSITIPEGFQGAKPMPKAGWQLDIVKQKLGIAYESKGETVTEDVRKITWYGNTLEHGHYDEFVFKGQIGVGATSKLYFPVTQECVSGALNWNQTPENPRGQSTTNKYDNHTGAMGSKRHAHHHAQTKNTDGDMLKMTGKHASLANSDPHADPAEEQVETAPEQHQDQVNHGNHNAGVSYGRHEGHGVTKLKYPAPFIRVIDGTGHHHH